MQFNCPSANENVVVTGPSPGPGAVGTICACGVANMGLSLSRAPWLLLLYWLHLLLNWLRRCLASMGLSHKPVTDGAQFVRVRVVCGPPPVPTPSPDPMLPGDVDTDQGPDGSWTAAGVWVPNASAMGSPLILFAWLLTTNNSGTSTVYDSGSVAFNGGGPNPTDCCASCGSGSGLSTTTGGLITELAGKTRLDITIPEGRNAGIHFATARAHLKWQAKIAGAGFTIEPCRQGKTLVIQGPSSRVSSKSISLRPFSATLPGTIFGATCDVVVT
jgi:hypothetical protein